MIYKININNPEAAIIQKAAEFIKKGELIICPTDTAYMLAANALNETAVRKVFAFKKRPLQNPIHVAVPDLQTAKKYVFINKYAKILAETFLPGPLTLILPKNLNPPHFPSILTADLPSLGIRIPANTICLSVLKQCNIPLTATSVNISTQPATYCTKEMEEQFGDRLKKISLILDSGDLPKVKPSTIVDLSGTTIKILRQGPISDKKILEILKEEQ